MTTVASAGAQSRITLLADVHGDVIYPTFHTRGFGLIKDLDRDGFLDALYQGNGMFVLYGDGKGIPQSLPLIIPWCPPWGCPTSGVHDVEIADYNADGHLDLFVNHRKVGFNNAEHELYIGAGQRTFQRVTATHMPANIPANSYLHSAAAVDFDGDGDMDIVLFGSPGGLVASADHLLLLNDGTGNFTNAGTGAFPQFSGYASDVVAGDFDNDGSLDFALANGLGPHEVYLNNGNGTYRHGTMPVAGTALPRIGAADFDNDGDLDLYLAGNSPSLLFINDGQGNFTDHSANLPLNLDWTNSFVLADFDLDGDVDIVNDGAAGVTARTYRNDGNLQFTDVSSTWFAYNGFNSTTVLGGDLDLDGDTDVLMTSAGTTFNYMNLYRHAFADRTPKIGTVHPVYVTGGGNNFAFLAFSAPAPASSLGTIGTLFLDPATAVVLGPKPILPNGATRFDVPIPNNPALSGVALTAQAMELDPATGEFRLTNAFDLEIQ